MSVKIIGGFSHGYGKKDKEFEELYSSIQQIKNEMKKENLQAKSRNRQKQIESNDGTGRKELLVCQA